MSGGNSDCNGYTLIELLVVMLLLSFITVALASGLRFGTRVWEQTESSVQDENRAVRAHALLRELLSSAVPVSKGEYIDFEGDPRHAVLVATAPWSLRSAGLVRIDMSLEKGRSAISLRVVPQPAGRPRSVDISIPGSPPSNLRLAYLDVSTSIPTWLDRWHDRNRLPDAIRVEASDDGARSTWPDLIVRLPIAQRPDCNFDPIALNCRSAP
jgi:prepilin-type N-terminal cleavage/methylation domain-containing protein